MDGSSARPVAHIRTRQSPATTKETAEMTPQDTPPADPGSDDSIRGQVVPAGQAVDAQVVRPLRLVIPPGFGEAATLRALARAIQQAHQTYADCTRASRAAFHQAQTAGDEPRQTYLRGKVTAYSNAAAHIEEHICGEFDLWDQSEAADAIPAEVIVLRAGVNGRNITRPEVPLPLPDTTSPDDSSAGNTDAGRLARLVEVMRARRDQYVALAIQFTNEAIDDLDDTPEGEQPRSRYHDRCGMARAFAMAADHLDESLAEAFDATPTYLNFLQEHRTWLERILNGEH